MNRHFLRFRDLPAADISPLLYRAIELKSGAESRALEGMSVALLFEKPSLRTKLSFWIGAEKLGGKPLYFSPEEVGLGKARASVGRGKGFGEYGGYGRGADFRAVDVG